MSDDPVLVELLADCDLVVEFRGDDDEGWVAGLIAGPVRVAGSPYRWARVLPANGDDETIVPIRSDRLRVLGAMIGRPA